MIKLFLGCLCLFVLNADTTLACDACGCGSGTTLQGVMPQLGGNFVGLRYRSAAFESHLKSVAALRTGENYQTIELWGRYNFSSWLQLIGTLPFSHNSQRTTATSFRADGVGDATVMLCLSLLPLISRDIDSACMLTSYHHSLLLGFGAKLPLGEYHSASVQNEADNAMLQIGTGSTDALLSLQYSLRRADLGLMLESQARIPSTNRDNYQYGIKCSSILAGFARIELGESASIMPLAGLSAELSTSDAHDGYVVDHTGGSVAFATVGADVYLSASFMLGAQAFVPIAQHLADGDTRALSRFTVQGAWMW